MSYTPEPKNKGVHWTPYFYAREGENLKEDFNNEIGFMEFHEHKFVIELIPRTKNV